MRGEWFVLDKRWQELGTDQADSRNRLRRTYDEHRHPSSDDCGVQYPSLPT